MNQRTLLCVAFGMLLVVATFDAITIPVARLSIADCAMLLSIAIVGCTRATLQRCVYLVAWIVPIIILANAVVFFFYEANVATKGTDFSVLVSGFIRPALFVLISLGFYGSLEKQNFTASEIRTIITVAALFLTIVVILQYLGIAPPMYHNNPSFGETGRYTVFSEGWRPTGLSNEASFVGIFLLLIFVASLKGVKYDDSWKWFGPKMGASIAFIGCFFTTSRLSLLLAVLFLIMQRPSIKKILLIFSLALLAIPLLDIGRFQNILAFDGDASTIERYGSLFAYSSALFDPSNIFGTGYLNSSAAVEPYIDPIVRRVLGERQLPAFSLPLQLLVELGPILCVIVLIVCWIKWRNVIVDSRLRAVIIVSFVTGIQNFIFVYIFIALVFYERHTCSAQESRGGRAHNSTA